MGIGIFWDEQDDSILYMEFVGKWSWVEYRRACDELMAVIAEVDYRIDIILDMRKAAAAPMDSDNDALRESLETSPYNLGLMIAVGADQFTRMIIGLMQKMIPIIQRKVVMVSSYDEAENVLMASRATTTPAYR